MLKQITTHENALESFAVATWREAEAGGDHAAWSRAYEHFLALQMYLAHLRLYPLSNTAGDLKVMAGIRGGLQPIAATPMKAAPTSLPRILRAS